MTPHLHPASESSGRGKWRLEDLLIQGEVDAEVELDLPQSWIRGDGTVERLFPDFDN